MAWRCCEPFQLKGFGVFGCEFRAWRDVDLYELLGLPNMDA